MIHWTMNNKTFHRSMGNARINRALSKILAETILIFVVFVAAGFFFFVSVNAATVVVVVVIVATGTPPHIAKSK